MITRSLFLFGDHFRPQPFEIPFLHFVDHRHVRVHLLVGVFVVVSSSGDLDADALRDVANAFGPDGFVQFHVHADVGRFHHLLREGFDLFIYYNCGRRETERERESVYSFSRDEEEQSKKKSEKKQPRLPPFWGHRKIFASLAHGPAN
jgi:hypothetical protein